MVTAWIFALLLAQDVLPPEMRQLVRIKQQMKANLSRLPNYTCMAEIERFRDTPKSIQWERVDVHRVEVALVGGAEWFSRPGAGRLETRSLRDLIPTGLVSNGEYANHARSLFLSSNAQFEYAGMERINGRETARFRYSVSRLNSGYFVQSGSEAVVPYHGSFWGDPQTGDLVRLTVEVVDIPPEIDIVEAVTAVDYARVRIGGEDFLLPERTDLVVVNRHGQAGRNRMTFTQCHQYGTESAVSFEPPEPLPPGLVLTLELDSAIDLEGLRGGAPILAKLVSEVRSQEKVLIPVGATVRGRVLQLDRRPGPPPQLHVVLEFDEITTAEHRYHFIAIVQSVTERQQVRRMMEPSPRLGVLSLLIQPPFRLTGLVSTWRTQ